VYGVSFDSVADNRTFAEKQDFPFPLLSDENREMGMAYGACDTEDAEYARRITYVIDEKGKILQAHPKVDTKTHAQQILASL